MAPSSRTRPRGLAAVALVVASCLPVPDPVVALTSAAGRSEVDRAPTMRLAGHDLGSFLPEARNQSGRMVGRIVLPTGEEHAAVMDAGRAPLDLGTGSQPESRAYAVNATGVVVGVTWDSTLHRALPFRWTHRTGLVELPLPSSVVRYGASAFDINDRGDILVTAQLNSEGQFIWRARSQRYEPLISAPGFVQPSALNNHGVVVGSLADATSQRVVYWDGGRDHLMHEVDARPPWPAYPRDLTDRGTAVGQAGDRSFTWDLATSRRRQVPLDSVSALNERGVISGWDVRQDEEGYPLQVSARLWDSRRGVLVRLSGIEGMGHCYTNGLSPDGVAVGVCSAGPFLSDARGVYWDAYRR